MSHAEQPLGAFFVDIVAPAHTEGTFPSLAELADCAFTLADEQAGVEPQPDAGIRTRYASILYPVGNNVEPRPIKAVLHQDAPPPHVHQVVVDFAANTVGCEGQPYLAVGPEQIEHAREEIRPHLQGVWERKREQERARQRLENLAWKDFFERLACNGVFDPAASGIDVDAPYSHKRCPLCETPTTACTACHTILCLNQACAASQLIPFRSCSHHTSTAACLPCLDSAKLVPALGQCPQCNLWYCQFELTWCLGRPKDSLDRSQRNPLRGIPNSAREHPIQPIGCPSCTGGQDRPHCSNGRCWSRAGGYSSVCEPCSPGGGLWCTCEQCWICDDCNGPPMDGCFKACPQCKQVYCVYECEYIQYCVECGRTTLCDDCVEEDWSAFAPGADEAVELKGTCRSSNCLGKFCDACIEGRRCTGCRSALCGECTLFQDCSACDGQFCSSCYRTHIKRACGSDI